jgi:hypothetical protein
MWYVLPFGFLAGAQAICNAYSVPVTFQDNKKGQPVHLAALSEGVLWLCKPV